MTNTERINIKPKNKTSFIQGLQKKLEKDSNRLLLLTILHLPLGLFLYSFGSLGIVHPLAVFVLGLFYAVNTKFKLDNVIYVSAYIVGCEVLWRMAETPIFWEFGKYGTSLLMVLALFRRGYFKIPGLAFLFIVLLLPACVMTLLTVSLKDAKDNISSNLSGPFSLFICCWFFSYVRMNQQQIKKLLIVIFIPFLTVGITTLFYTVANSDEITFNTESNFGTSGGFGPNQVSSMLGLGVYVGLTCYLLYKDGLKFKFYFALGAVFLATQSVLTFSRGGIYNALGATAVLVVFQSQNFAQTVKRILPIAMVAGLFLLLIFPFMNDFTGGKLQERFEDTGTTRRTELIESDFQILAENPVLGAGLGNAKTYREKFLGYDSASHTEFSRLISEHGIFGIFAMFILFLMTFLNVLRQNSVFGRAIVAGTIVWCSLFMLNAGMRLAAPSFFWGFSFINIVEMKFRRRNPINLEKAKKTQNFKLTN